MKKRQLYLGRVISGGKKRNTYQQAGPPRYPGERFAQERCGRLGRNRLWGRANGRYGGRLGGGFFAGRMVSFGGHICNDNKFGGQGRSVPLYKIGLLARKNPALKSGVFYLIIEGGANFLPLFGKRGTNHGSAVKRIVQRIEDIHRMVAHIGFYAARFQQKFKPGAG